MNELVELVQISPNILLDIRYATFHNFTGKPVYRSNRCFLLYETAKRLNLVQINLEKRGLGLKVFDGYRPLSIQKIFWELIPDSRFVADPKEGSRHNRGAAIDLTLVRSDGSELGMPTDFDDFSERASRQYRGGDVELLKNRELLEKVMVDEGFIPYEHEWWHFDDPNWENYPILDVAIPS